MQGDAPASVTVPPRGEPTATNGPLGADPGTPSPMDLTENTHHRTLATYVHQHDPTPAQLTEHGALSEVRTR